MANPLTIFAREINREYQTGTASERSYYDEIQELLKACSNGIITQVESTGEKAGIPDIRVGRREQRIGYVEVKLPGVDLADIERRAGEGQTDHNATQFSRYRDQYDNLLYTNCLEWRLYRKGKREPLFVIELNKLSGSRISKVKEAEDDFVDMIGTFLAADPQSLTDAQSLAKEMARLTRILRKETEKAFGAGNDFLEKLFEAFRDELITQLKADEFADMYAQTIAYGLFTARNMRPEADSFDRYSAGTYLPKTNPFLRKVFSSMASEDNMPPEIEWIVEDLAALIKSADMVKIRRELSGYEKRRKSGDLDLGEKDPIIYFYEPFLAEYDSAKREARGVYYTPLPVVSYIVRSIDRILVEDFGKPDGLADKEVIILDPACGTGTFLYEVLNLIYERVGNRSVAHWKNEVVPNLLKRMFGFELLMAPYTIAHLKLANRLEETGYEFESDQRLGIYLTNTLEKGIQHKVLLGLHGTIAEESNLAAGIKNEEPVMVILGNPPYSGHSQNTGKWISQELMKDGYDLPDGTKRPGYYEVDGKPLGERNPKWLQDDYVKFLRWSQWRIDKEGRGIVGMITNHGYLDNPTFRGMRQNLMASFDEIRILDLHGNSKKKETAPDGSKDENVFDIQQGVAIGLFVKPETKKAKEILHADLYGLRQEKYVLLRGEIDDAIEFEEANPNKPHYLFVPRDEELRKEYNQNVRITDVFSFTGQGFKTHRDTFAIGYTRQIIEERIRGLKDDRIEDDYLFAKYSLKDTGTWSLRDARRALKENEVPTSSIKKCLYRPFDFRYCFLDRRIMDRPRFQSQMHLFKENIALTTTRSIDIQEGFEHVFCVNIPFDHHGTSLKEANYLIPLYLYPSSDQSDMGLYAAEDRLPNISTEFAQEFLSAIGAERMENSPRVGQRSNNPDVIYPEDIFYYIYAVLHSPTYRERYADFLKIDFPRIPLPEDYDSFDRLAAIGQELVELHLMKRKSWGPYRQFGEAEDTTVGKVKYDAKAQEIILDASKEPEDRVRIGKVPAHVWEFRIGGYQVADKWLKDRKGVAINLGDYVPILWALAETYRLMGEVG